MPSSISGSVGDSGGQNFPEDVHTVYELFNTILAQPLTVSDQVSTELIAAIRDFQSDFMSHPDGRIDVGGRTWRKLTAAADASEGELSGSIGDTGGLNRARDVRIVYALFNKILPTPLVVSDVCSVELMQAIRNFQSAFMSRPDGRIDVGGRTWGKLTAAAENPDSGNGGGNGNNGEEIPPDAEINLGGPDAAWTAYYQWSDRDEADFSHWVERLFADKKGSLAACLRNPEGNTLYSDEDRNNNIFSDCADLPYLLRAYFSYKKKLPFSFNVTISGSRYSNNNRPRSRRYFLNSSSFSSLARTISTVCIAVFFVFSG
ncbi:MAG: hypothetical protein D3916_14140, partial [Candidatus Electrothrix sp. MAN1_4]|nr:hypothetical protein [Candidatus Electrothrix sp. MAN1_4]